MRTEFEIKINTADMYGFLMYHTYHGVNGIFSIVAGLALIIFYFFRRGTVANDWIYVAFGILFLLYLPWTLYTRAAQQVRLGTAFKLPLQYTVSEEGIQVQQGENTIAVGWQDVYKVKESGRSILVYTGKKSAFIWVKKQMGEQENTARQLLKQCVPSKRLSLKKA